MFYSQVILAKKGPLAKVWLAAHWGDKKLARPQIFATDISQSCVDIMNPTVPLALRLSGHLLLGVVRIYSRKVKYVLNDCTEAMLKLQMAFSKQQQQQANSSIGMGSELLTEKDGQQQLVANFGEFDRVHVVEGFCLPLPEDNEWILADDRRKDGNGNDDDAGFLSRPNRDLGLLLLPSGSSRQAPLNPLDPSSQMHGDDDEEEEQWAPFDPDDDEEGEDDLEGLPTNTRVSEIEVVRAANDSLLSEDRTVRASLDPEKIGTPARSEGPIKTEATSRGGDVDEYDFTVPFGDDGNDGESETNGGPETPGGDAFGVSGLDDSALRLLDENTPSGAADTSGLAMDDEMTPDSRLPGGTSTAAAETPATQTKRPSRRRRRKRRKVVIDNHATELTNEAIRGMLSDADDIVFHVPHPASLWDEEGTGKTYAELVLEELARFEREHQQPSRSKKSRAGGLFRDPTATASKSKNNTENQELSLTRPFVADGNGPALHPVLAKLWEDNYWKALGRPCPYPRETDDNDDDDDAREADDVEVVRRARNDDDDDDSASHATQRSDLEVRPVKTDRQQEDADADADGSMDFPAAVDDELEDDEDLDVPVPDFGDDGGEFDGASPGLNKRKRDGNEEEEEDLLDLGMVNDMIVDEDDEEEEDETTDDRPVTSSSSTKWHKHTVRVYNHLRKCLRDDGNEEVGGGAAAAAKPESIRFRELTKHIASRRNASSVFFEMLQLKTWDFIELDQDESYGDIGITAGLRFGEDAPNN